MDDYDIELTPNDPEFGPDECESAYALWAFKEDGELLSCFDFNRFGEIAVNNGYVDLCETCYVNKGGDWPLLDEYSFEEIGGETVAEWRGRVAQEKPAAPSEIAYAASALAALSADDGAGVTARAAKL